MDAVARVRDAHEARFGGTPRLFAAPGRVNLIGEHTDYNDGFVLPMAIDRTTVAAATPNGTAAMRVHSVDMEDTTVVPIDRPFEPSGTWADYASAVIASVQDEFPLHQGLDITLSTDIPIGAGLSSSAAFEIALTYALFALSDAEVNPERLAAVGRRAEQDYVGIRSGVMDQLVCALARAGCALTIDCRSLQAIPIAIPSGVSVLVMDSGVKHALAFSEYNVRRDECEQAVTALQKMGLEIDSLRDVTPDALARYGKSLKSPIAQRARHVVEENERTKRAVQALVTNDVALFGRLMDESHASLRDLYAVSTPELDEVVTLARSVNGVLGARMTGGGFGGCAIALVMDQNAQELRAKIYDKYYRPRNIHAVSFVTLPSAGAHEITN